MLKRLLLPLFAAAIVLLAGSGCHEFKAQFRELFGPGFNYTPKYVLTLHRIVRYPRGNELETQIRTFDGQKIWIGTNQYFSSKYFTEIALVPRIDKPNFYDLKLKLDNRGKLIWMQLCAEFQGQKVAIMIDGVYSGEFVPIALVSEEEDWVTLVGPFNNLVAEGMMKYASDNYLHFNPSTSSLF
ncbi:MAG: hypothetical protein PHS41_12660 [Victivallaceae bacterium]|nr:hypothetical protein [Victivallaceae bacterium]